jgi:hypothetical protein
MRTTPSRFSAYVTSSERDGGRTVIREPKPRPAPPPAGASILEARYPAVVRTLTLLWGYPELNDYLNRVANGLDTRLADMEPAALAELMLLAQIHRRICPHLPARNIEDVYGTSQWGGPWRPAGYRR